MADYRRASPSQIARVLDLAEITGVTVPWIAAWYRIYFGRPLDQMDAATARALITYLPYWPVRVVVGT